MLSKTIGTTLAVVSLACSSAAVAQSAAPTAMASPSSAERAGASVDDAGQLRGTTLWIVGAIALGLLIWGAIELLDDNEEDFPVSP